MFHDHDRQFGPARRDERGQRVETVPNDTAPSGVPLDVFWALVDPVDRPGPRSA